METSKSTPSASVSAPQHDEESSAQASGAGAKVQLRSRLRTMSYTDQAAALAPPSEGGDNGAAVQRQGLVGVLATFSGSRPKASAAAVARFLHVDHPSRIWSSRHR